MDTNQARSRRVEAVSGGLVVLLASGAAQAAPGEHIRLGYSTEVTPALQVAGEYHSNPYLASGAAGDPPDPGLAVRVTPSAHVRTDAQALTLEFTGNLDLRKYLATAFVALDRYSDYNFVLNADVLPQSAIGLHGAASLKNRARALDGDANSADAPIATDLNLKRRTQETLLQLAFHPGGALSVSAGGHLSSDHYRLPDDYGSATLDRVNSRTAYGADLDASWRFFPRTAVVFDGSVDVFDWEKNIVVYDKDTAIARPDGALARSLLGIRGRLTDKLEIGVLGGYGQIRYDPGSVRADSNAAVVAPAQLATLVSSASTSLSGLPNGALVVVEGAWSPRDDQTLTVGFHRDFADVNFTNDVGYNNVFARYQGTFADRLIALAEATYRQESYRGSVTREDTFLRGRAGLTVRASKVVDLSADLVYSSRDSADGMHPEVDYTDLTATLSATFSY